MKTHITSSLALLAALVCQPSIVSAQSSAEIRIPTHEPPRIERHLSGGLDKAAEEVLHDERAALRSAPGSALSVRGRSFGLGQFEGELWGAGPDFKAHFTGAGIDFTPALGRAVERNHGLAFSLESVRRGDSLLYAGLARVPVADGNVVRYVLAPGLTESYEVRRDGVEQSYLFESLPPGSGELVVRGRLRSDFPGAMSDGSGGLRFELPGIGGVSYGAVTGIDANGVRAAGELRLDGDALELVLPAAFVDSAALPLVLDPLLGTNIGVEVGTGDDRDADIAYDSFTNGYLFVWENRISGSDVDIWAQRVNGTGVLMGTMVAVEPTTANIAINPTVANCRLSGRFLVAWQEGTSPLGPWHIEVALVSASMFGATSASVALTTDTASDVDPDAGGDSTLTDDEVVVTYHEVGSGIKARYVTVPLAGDPVPSTTITIMTSANVSKPAISKSGGSAGRYLVVWQRFSSPTPPVEHDLWRALIDRDANILVSQSIVATTTGADEEDPDVDGDGTNFMIVYERELGAGSGDNDIYCRMATYNVGTSLTISAATVVEADGNDDEINPAVGFAGYKYLVAWADAASGLNYDVSAMGLSTSNCIACEPELPVDISSSGVDQIEIATQQSGGVANFLADGAWLAWGSMEITPGFEGDIEGQSWQALGSGGAVVDLGGGCGGGGTTAVNGPVALGNSSFALTLAGADPTASIGLLNFAGAAAPLVCGTCTSNPLFLFFPKAVSSGAASISVPIPCDLSLLGGAVQVNWTVLPTLSSPCPIFTNISNSNRLSLTIGT